MNSPIQPNKLYEVYDEQFEESIQLRIIVCIMAMMCISIGCAFVSTPWLMTSLYIFCAAIGSFLSYQYRHEKSKLLHGIALVGVLLVMANFIRELHYGSESGTFDIYTPFIHLVSGVFAAHTFELNTRSAINQSAILGLVLLCLMAPVGRSAYFGTCVGIYLCLGTMMLYYDCISRTLRSSLWPTFAKALPFTSSEGVHRRAQGSIILTVALLPLLSAVAFVLIPRGDRFVDYVWSKVSRQIHFYIFPSDIPKIIKETGPTIQRQKFQPVFNSANSGATSGSPSYNKSAKLQENISNKPSSIDDSHQIGKQHKHDTAPTNALEKLANQQTGTGLPTANGNPNSTSPANNNIKNDSQTSTLPGANANKVMDLGYGLRPTYLDKNELLFRVTSNRTEYFRRDCFDGFDGRRWTASDKKDLDRFTKDRDVFIVDKSIQDSSQPKSQTRAFVGAILGFDTINLEQNFQIENAMGTALPVVWLPQKIYYPGQEVTVDIYGTVTGSSPLVKGTKYKVISKVPVYDLDALAHVKRPGSERENKMRQVGHSFMLLLPSNESENVVALAQGIAGEQGNWFVQAERIADYLRKHYVYDKEIEGHRGSTSDSGVYKNNLADQFILETKSGNCEDFTTAFVIMCRAAGIPARCAGGFTPGEYNRVTGTHDVRAKHSHCWGEIYLPDGGWIPIDPTPGGSLPTKAKETSFDLNSLQQSIIPNSAENKNSLSWSEALFYGVTGLIVLLVIILGARQLFVIYNKWQTKHVKIHPATRIFRKLVTSLKKIDLKITDSDTPADINKKFKWIIRQNLKGANDSSISTTMDHFMEAYEAVYFGNHQRLHELEKTSRELHDLLSTTKGAGKN